METRDRLREGVASLKSQVEKETRTAQECVQHAVENVAEAIDVRAHIRGKPFLSLIGGLALGTIVGGLCFSRSARGKTHVSEAIGHLKESATNHIQEEKMRVVQGSPSGIEAVLEHFAPEIRELKRYTVSTLTSSLRELVRKNVPYRFAPKVDEVFDTVIRKV